ncbi:hypothetical protein M422DRAFT_26145 [Sphaerobolus stellatus SS14]|nr:hypothetical protein M422DRAFT_26145 [Sphaerobolus stellatus SS14]
MATFFRSYNAALLRRPMLTQCITAGILFGGGDIIAQQAIEKRGARNHDYERTARLTVYGGLIFGPMMTKWYQWLGGIKFKTPARALATRVALDQGVLTPVAVAFFYSCMTFLEGKGVDEAQKRVKAEYVPTLLKNWGVFLPTQVINFSIVPPHLRFGVVGVVSLFWNSYLSYSNARQTKAKIST